MTSVIILIALYNKIQPEMFLKIIERVRIEKKIPQRIEGPFAFCINLPLLSLAVISQSFQTR